MPIYAELSKDADFRLAQPAVAAAPDVDSDSTEVDIGGQEPGTSRGGRGRAANQKKKRTEKVTLDTNLWKSQSQQLLQMIFQCDDSVPFRHPVDDMEYPVS